MKFSSSLLAAGVLSLSSSLFNDASAQPPPHARGRARKFNVPITGPADIDLGDDAPRVQCNMSRGKGPANARFCQSGVNTVTVVDADCPDGSSSTDCTAASIIEGETGRVWHVNPDGSVDFNEQAEFPDEGEQFEA